MIFSGMRRGFLNTHLVEQDAVPEVQPITAEPHSEPIVKYALKVDTLSQTVLGAQRIRTIRIWFLKGGFTTEELKTWSKDVHRREVVINGKGWVTTLDDPGDIGLDRLQSPGLYEITQQKYNKWFDKVTNIMENQ